MLSGERSGPVSNEITARPVKPSSAGIPLSVLSSDTVVTDREDICQHLPGGGSEQRGGGDVRCEVVRVLCRLKSGLAWTDWPALHKLLTIIRVLSPALPSSQQPHRGNRSAGLLHHISTRPGPVRHETNQAVRFSIGIHHYQVIKCISVSNINI